MADFSSGLFDCLSDTGTCCYGWYFGCCLFRDNFRTIRGTANPCCMCLCPISLFWVRQTLRMRKHMDKSYCSDCLTTCLCWELANCQHARELKQGNCLPDGSEYYGGEAPAKGHQPQQTVVVVNAQPGAYGAPVEQ